MNFLSASFPESDYHKNKLLKEKNQIYWFFKILFSS